MSKAPCKDCKREHGNGRMSCTRHWRRFRAWLHEKGLYAAFAMGTQEEHVRLFRRWRRAERSQMDRKATDG